MSLVVLTKEQFYEQGEKLFGKNRRDWVFCCEWCKFEQSFNSIKKQLNEKGFIKSMRYGIITEKNLDELQPKPDQECLSENCNYVSYGLIGSGLEVDDNRYLMLKGMTKLNKCDAS